MLGTSISEALARVGITPERAETFVGAPCGCQERRDKLDALDTWARRVLQGKLERAREYLEGLLP